MKKIFLLSLLIVAGMFAIGGAVFAESSTLSVLPGTLDSAVGKTFNVSVQVNPTGNKVCVVKGVLSFEGLACQDISVASGIMAQVSPTCSSPSFTLGIPNCSVALQNLITVSVKSSAVGTGKINLSNVKVIGAGVDVSFSLQNGVYNIVAPKAVVETVQPAVTIKPTSEKVETAPVVPEETVAQNNTAETVIPDNAGTAALATQGSKFSKYFWPLLIILIILGIIYGIYWFGKRKKEKKNSI